jgi:hypothetical protein
MCRSPWKAILVAVVCVRSNGLFAQQPQGRGIRTECSRLRLGFTDKSRDKSRVQTGLGEWRNARARGREKDLDCVGAAATQQETPTTTTSHKTSFPFVLPCLVLAVPFHTHALSRLSIACLLQPSLFYRHMLALKKKREADKKQAAEEAAANPGGKVSLLGVGGQKKKSGNGATGKKRTPGEIRIQKGRCKSSPPRKERKAITARPNGGVTLRIPGGGRVRRPVGPRLATRSLFDTAAFFLTHSPCGTRLSYSSLSIYNTHAHAHTPPALTLEQTLPNWTAARWRKLTFPIPTT